MTVVYAWVVGAGFLGYFLGAMLRFLARFEEVV